LVLLERAFPISLEQGTREMLKITGQKNAAPASMSIILEGKLAGPWVEELKSYWRQLSGVTYIDAGGKALLTKLWQQGAELRATGCLTRCVVEDITGSGRGESSQRKHHSTN
jgi:hypothetical protein